MTDNLMLPAVPRVVEIVGPAGAGKTTLGTVLSGKSNHVCCSNFPDVHSIRDAPFFIWNGLCMASLLRFRRDDGIFMTRRQFAWMSILNGWPYLLRKKACRSGRTLILDQGPIYLMAELSEFGPSYLQGPRFETLWRGLYSRWANTLDMIVWLDADDEHLVHRIRTRKDEHIVKDATDRTICAFLARYRGAYDRVISRLSTGNVGPGVLRFDTGALQTEQIAHLLLARFGFASSQQDLTDISVAQNHSHLAGF